MLYTVAGYVLIVVHLALWLWAAGGMAEWLGINVPWPPYSNPDFPRWLLLIHWTAVLVAATGYLLGAWQGWSGTPSFMFLGYGLMALVCVIETFGYMTSSTKYLAMALEFATYAGILYLLHRPAFQAEHFPPG